MLVMPKKKGAMKFLTHTHTIACLSLDGQIFDLHIETYVTKSEKDTFSAPIRIRK